MFDVLYCRVSDIFTIILYHVYFTFEIETANVINLICRTLFLFYLKICGLTSFRYFYEFQIDVIISLKRNYCVR